MVCEEIVDIELIEAMPTAQTQSKQMSAPVQYIVDTYCRAQPYQHAIALANLTYNRLQGQKFFLVTSLGFQ